MTERAELLAKVASLYYEGDLTQEEIARQIGGSRSTVSRLLNEARETGIIEIRIRYPWKTESRLEQELEEKFGLQEAMVLACENRSHDEILKGLGIIAARYIDQILTPESVLGISWGTAVHSTVQALKPTRRLPITVVQMIGAVGLGDPIIDGPDLARFLANVYGGEYRYLHAPLIVESQQIQQAFQQESRIMETLTIARNVDVALVGIGSIQPEVSSLLRAGYLDKQALAELRLQGAIGDICARHYDLHGKLLDIELNRRIVGIELNDLRNINRVIGVAGGEAKAEAITGALRGGYVNVLVTDDAAAQKVMEFK